MHTVVHSTVGELGRGDVYCTVGLIRCTAAILTDVLSVIHDSYG